MCPLHTYIVSIFSTSCLGTFMRLNPRVSTILFFLILKVVPVEGGKLSKVTAHKSD